MKRYWSCSFLALCLLAASPVSAQGARGPQAVGELDATETADLLFSREEEKLARDTYISLYELWDAQVFANIAVSEQRHMDTMLNMIELFGLTDPVTSDEPGEFSPASGFTEVYQNLMARGDDSLLEALRVGGYIEELDIQDLMAAVACTDEPALVNAYTNLLAGSRNHLRAFVSHIASLGGTYGAQVLTQEQVDAIVGDYLGVGGGVGPIEGFTINANLSDAWYYPGTDGQGFFLSVFPDQQKILLAWFTFDTVLPEEDAEAVVGNPGQRWLTAQGSYQGAQAELQVFSSSGGLFDTALPAPTHEMVGSILLEFQDCANGSIYYDLLNVGEGFIPIERVALDNVTHCQRNNLPPDS